MSRNTQTHITNRRQECENKEREGVQRRVWREEESNLIILKPHKLKKKIKRACDPLRMWHRRSTSGE